MPRGIVPVAALLIIASAFSQFGATSAPVAFTYATQTSQHPPVGSPPGRAQPGNTRSVPTSVSSEVCKDLYSCVLAVIWVPGLPRASMSGRTRRYCAHRWLPSILVNRVSGKLPPIANMPEIGDPNRVSDACSEGKNSLDRWCLGRVAWRLPPLS
jgi:hypothetical protein